VWLLGVVSGVIGLVICGNGLMCESVCSMVCGGAILFSCWRIVDCCILVWSEVWLGSWSRMVLVI